MLTLVDVFAAQYTDIMIDHDDIPTVEAVVLHILLMIYLMFE